MEVRHITKKISDLNEKLDVSSTLSEPRENSFLKFEYKHNSALANLSLALDRFGSVKISQTFPALCSASLQNAIIHLKCMVTVRTVDYHGNPRTSGGDPLICKLSNEKGEAVDTHVEDLHDGTYSISFTPRAACTHKLALTIFGRAIRDSPFLLQVTEHNNPVGKYGSHGNGEMQFVQPLSVLCNTEMQELYVLDTGNSRVQVLDTVNTQYKRQIRSVGLEQNSGTGMALTGNNTLVVINWRTKHITEVSCSQGHLLKKFTCQEFVEPISVAVNKAGEVIVADNGVGLLFVFDAAGRLLRKIGSKGDKPGQFKLITSVSCDPVTDDILVTDNRVQIFNRAGQYLAHLQSPSAAKGTFGGVTVDQHGNILASRCERSASFVQVYNSSRKWLFNIDSHDDKLKRPSGLVTVPGGHVLVVDLGNNCLKKFRYM